MLEDIGFYFGVAEAEAAEIEASEAYKDKKHPDHKEALKALRAIRKNQDRARSLREYFSQLEGES